MASQPAKLPVRLTPRLAEYTGSLRSGLQTAVCHCLPKGKQCAQPTSALLLSKQWHTQTPSRERQLPVGGQ